MKSFLILAFFNLAIVLSSFSQVQKYKMHKILVGHASGLNNLRFSPSGKVLASSDLGGKVIIWNVKTGQTINVIDAHTSNVNEVSFSSDGKRIVTAGGGEGCVRVWDTYTGKLINTFYNIQKTKTSGVKYFPGVYFAFFSPDNSTVFFGGDGGYLMKGVIGNTKSEVFFSALSLKLYYRMTGGALSPDKKGIVISMKNFVLGLSLSSGQPIKNFIYPSGMAVNDVNSIPNSNEIATWNYDGKVTRWNYTTSSIIKSVKVAPASTVGAASFDKKRRFIAAGNNGNVVKLYDANTGKMTQSLYGHSKPVGIVRVSSYEDIIASGSSDRRVILWKIAVPEPVKKVIVRDTVYLKRKVIKRKKVIVRDTVYLQKNVKSSSVNLGVLEDEAKVMCQEVHFNDIYFDDATKSFLDKIALYLKANPSKKITSKLYSKAGGVLTSSKRLVVIKNHFLEKGISSTRLSFSTTNSPLCSTSSSDVLSFEVVK